MKRCRVVARCSSRVRVARGTMFELVQEHAGIRVVVGTIYETDQHGTAVPGWLQIEVECSAVDPARAEMSALQTAHQIACMLSLIGNAPISFPEVALLYEIREDDDPRVWEQQIHQDQALMASRLIDVSDLKNLLAAIDNMEIKAANQVSRGLRWYRSALATDDLLERFTMVWSGLECLNRLLIDHLEIPAFEESACRKCGHIVKKPSAAGVHTWIEKTQGRDVRNKARDLRTQLTHGFGDIEDAVSAVDEVGPKVERSLVLAILELIKVTVNPPAEPLAPQLQYVAKLTGTLRGPVEKAIAAARDHPHVASELAVKTSKNVGPDNGSVEFEYALPGETRVPNGVTLTVEHISIPKETV